MRRPTPSAPPAVRRAGARRPGRRRRPASGRTPTPRRTWSAAGTATGCWSSSPRTPPTPPPARGCRAGCGWSSTARHPARRQHRRPAGRRRGRRGWRRCGRRPSATRRPASAGSAWASPPSSRSATSRRVISTDGGVRFSAERTRAEVAAAPGARRRAGAAAGERCRCSGCRGRPRGPPPDGFATEVVLPLRAGRPRRRSRRRWPSCRPTCCSRCPGSGRRGRRGRRPAHAGDRPGRRIAPGSPTTARTTVWRVAQRSGELPAALLADRPVEERARRGWTVTWAVPLDDDGVPRPLPAGQVVHAPTPSDEPLSLPLRLIAPFPLGPDRRHVAPGPVTDALVAAAPTRSPTS